MSTPFTKTMFRCLLVALAGALIVLLATEALRVLCAQSEIDRAALRLGDGRPGAALAILGRCGAWTRFHPPIERRRLAAMIRCEAQRNRQDVARSLADDFDATFESAAGAAGWQTVERLAARLVGGLLLRQDRGWLMEKGDGLAILTEDVGTAQSPTPPTDAPRRAQTAASLNPATGQTAAATADAMNAGDDETFEAFEELEDSTASDEAVNPSVPAIAKETSPAPSSDASAAGAGPRWGIVRTPDTPSYDLANKPRKALNLGTVFGITGFRDTPNGRMAVCRNATGMGSSLLVSVDRLEIHPGALAAASRAERDLRARRVTLLHSIGSLTRGGDSGNDALAGNPHAAQYRAAREAYKALIEKAREAHSRWESSSGATRMAAADELRQMKNDQAPVKQAYEQAKAKVEAWAADNPPPDKNAPPPPELETLRTQVREIETALGSLE
jgi:hypothetical protein